MSAMQVTSEMYGGPPDPTSSVSQVEDDGNTDGNNMQDRKQNK